MILDRTNIESLQGGLRPKQGHVTYREEVASWSIRPPRQVAGIVCIDLVTLLLNFTTHDGSFEDLHE